MRHEICEDASELLTVWVCWQHSTGPVLQSPVDWGVGVAAARTVKKRMAEKVVWDTRANVVKVLVV